MPRRRFWMTTVVVSSACGAGHPAPAPDVATRAARIDAELPALRHDSGTVLGLASEGATIDAAYRGPQLRRLTATFFGETGRAHETFYYDPALFLVIRHEARYDAPLSGHVVDSTIRRYDLTSAGVPVGRGDSLTTAARELLQALAERRP